MAKNAQTNFVQPRSFESFQKIVAVGDFFEQDKDDAAKFFEINRIIVVYFQFLNRKLDAVYEITGFF